MVMAEIDKNYIDAEPIKNRTEDEMIRSYKLLYEIRSRTQINHGHGGGRRKLHRCRTHKI